MGTVSPSGPESSPTVGRVACSNPPTGRSVVTAEAVVSFRLSRVYDSSGPRRVLDSEPNPGGNGQLSVGLQLPQL